MPEPIALFDMDGTLVDYDGPMRRSLEALRAPSEPVEYDRAEELPHLEARRKTIQRQAGWWRYLPRHQPGFMLLDVITELNFQINVLTKGPRGSPNAWTEKLEWCIANLPDTARIHVVSTKGLVYGRVLVDDWPDYITDWLKHRPRGLVIMPAHKHNEGFEHPQVMRFASSTDLPTITAALRKARAECDE